MREGERKGERKGGEGDRGGEVERRTKRGRGEREGGGERKREITTSSDYHVTRASLRNMHNLCMYNAPHSLQQTQTHTIKQYTNRHRTLEEMKEALSGFNHH